MKEPIREEDLPKAWTKPRKHARMHILRAHKASKAVIIRRKPSKVFHIISWDTTTDELVHGSWFKGGLFPYYCDLSWDGEWMVYFAMGSKGAAWTGICKPPQLKTVLDSSDSSMYTGGGYFSSEKTLHSNDFDSAMRRIRNFFGLENDPFKILPLDWSVYGNDILSLRLKRDGWQQEGTSDNWVGIRLKHSGYALFCPDNPGWSWQPTKQHPILRMFYRGYLVGGYRFEFQLEGSDLLGPEVDWATWDAKGDLLVARNSAIERYTLNALETGVPDFRCDLEHLTPPDKPTKLAR
ncbi:MAG: hypothetical protein J0L72_08295 [Armatimonadetes bacterium]|nr:hypothetical protein [Armatimonadota bacterium]